MSVNDLSVEILQNIFDIVLFQSAKDFISCSCVCVAWNNNSTKQIKYRNNQKLHIYQLLKNAKYRNSFINCTLHYLLIGYHIRQTIDDMKDISIMWLNEIVPSHLNNIGYVKHINKNSLSLIKNTNKWTYSNIFISDNLLKKIKSIEITKYDVYDNVKYWDLVDVSLDNFYTQLNKETKTEYPKLVCDEPNIDTALYNSYSEYNNRTMCIINKIKHILQYVLRIRAFALTVENNEIEKK